MTDAHQTIRNVNDCEIHSISFTENAVHLRLFDSSEVDYLTIVFRGLRHMIFETNHYQNVLSSLAIFDTWDDMKKDPAASQWLEKLSPSALGSGVGNAKIAYFQPTAGGETLIVFEELEFNA